MKPQGKKVLRLPHWTEMLRTVLAAILFGTLLIALLDRGAVSAEARVLLTLITYAVLLVGVLAFGVPDHARVPVIVSCLLLVAIGSIVYLQTTPGGPLPPDPVWMAAGPFAAPVAGPTVSLVPADDRFALLSVCLPFGLFMAGLLLFDTDERAARALSLISHAGGVISLWAIVQFTLFPTLLVVEEKRFYFESLTAFFVNKNTTGTFLGLVVLLHFARFWQVARNVRPATLWAVVIDGARISPDEREKLVGIFWSLLWLNVSVVALMLTKSRAGVGSAFASLLLLSFLLVREEARRRATEPLRKAAIFRSGAWRYGAPLALIAVFFALFGGDVARRLAVGSGSEGRMCFLPDMIDALRDHLPWGSGLAGFEMTYAPYGRAACGITTVLTRAHNVYLEGLLGLGLAFVPIALCGIATLAWIFIRGARIRGRYRHAGFLGLAALTLVLLHSTLDFSLQIPGFAATFALYLAPLSTLCLRPGGTARQRRRQRRPKKPENTVLQS